MQIKRKIVSVTFMVAVLLIQLQAAERSPKLLWSPQEIEALKASVAAHDWAKEAVAQMPKRFGKRAKSLVNLFKIAILADEQANEKIKKEEIKYLLHIIGTHPKNAESMEHGGLHYDNHLDVLRYDILYNDLTPQQRSDIEETFRTYIAYQLTDEKKYTKVSWLPNMQWPRPMTAHMMAVALEDEDLIRQVFEANGGWYMYFDRCLYDKGFYLEEFGKMTAMIGQMMMYCRALDNIGLSQYGFDYVGADGATMAQFVSTYLDITYPRIDIPGGLPQYPIVTMGDSKGGGFKSKTVRAPRVFQRSLVNGYLADGVTGGNPLVLAYNMTGRDHRGGKVPKMQKQLIFEMAHQKWPDAGYDYFLAQMRKPGEAAYVPTMFFGGEPIDPGSVEAPPAPSWVAPTRGLAMLRANQTADFWESPDPAVALQFATLYVHYTADCFSLLGYVAFNRSMYLNRPISHGYNGGPYDFHVRGHCGVVVDGLQAEPIGTIPYRSDFNDIAQYVAIRSKVPEQLYSGKELRSSDDLKRSATHIYPGVDMARSLILTKEYLFDAFYLNSETERQYHWLVHAMGHVLPEDSSAWQADDGLQQRLFNHPSLLISGAHYRSESGNWDLALQQDYLGDDINSCPLGAAWYERKIGVRVRALGEEGTQVWYYTPPRSYTPGSDRGPRDGKQGVHDQAGAVSIAIERKAKQTAFVVLHEPYEHGQSKIQHFRRIAQNDQVVVAEVQGPDYRDIIIARLDNGDDQAVRVDFEGGSVVLSNSAEAAKGYALLRLRDGEVTLRGGIASADIALSVMQFPAGVQQPAGASIQGERWLYKRP